MASWKDGETSSEDSVSPLFNSHADETYIPQTIVDPEWCGIVAGGPMCCHNLPVHRAVVFQGINTGRRFYGCGNQFTEDVVLSAVLRGKGVKFNQCLTECVWKNVMRENYQKIMQDGDVENAVVQAQEEKAKLEKDNIELRTALQVIKQSNDELVRNWKQHVADEGVQQIEQMKKEKKKLEYIIADLLKDGEANKMKMRKIKEICDE
nr:uncharacterized protein LOC109778313 [Aegilops tauschii subsp. strangulata]